MMFTHTADGPQPHTRHDTTLPGLCIFATSRPATSLLIRLSYPLNQNQSHTSTAFGLELPPAAGAEWTDRTRLYLPGTTEWRVPLATEAAIEIRKKATSRHEMSTAV